MGGTWCGQRKGKENRGREKQRRQKANRKQFQKCGRQHSNETWHSQTKQSKRKRKQRARNPKNRQLCTHPQPLQSRPCAVAAVAMGNRPDLTVRSPFWTDELSTSAEFGSFGKSNNLIQLVTICHLNISKSNTAQTQHLIPRTKGI